MCFAIMVCSADLHRSDRIVTGLRYKRDRRSNDEGDQPQPVVRHEAPTTDGRRPPHSPFPRSRWRCPRVPFAPCSRVPPAGGRARRRRRSAWAAGHRSGRRHPRARCARRSRRSSATSWGARPSARRHDPEVLRPLLEPLLRRGPGGRRAPRGPRREVHRRRGLRGLRPARLPRGRRPAGGPGRGRDPGSASPSSRRARPSRSRPGSGSPPARSSSPATGRRSSGTP